MDFHFIHDQSEISQKKNKSNHLFNFWILLLPLWSWNHFCSMKVFFFVNSLGEIIGIWISIGIKYFILIYMISRRRPRSGRIGLVWFRISIAKNMKYLFSDFRHFFTNFLSKFFDNDKSKSNNIKVIWSFVIVSRLNMNKIKLQTDIHWADLFTLRAPTLKMFCYGTFFFSTQPQTICQQIEYYIRQN